MDPYDIVDAFDAIEDELIESIIRNMKRHHLEEVSEKKEWSMWQTMQLESLERYKKINREKYKKKFKDINSKIEHLIREANEKGYMGQEIEILEAIKNGFEGYHVAADTLQAEFFKVNERKLEALIRATTRDMQKAETAILRMADDKYRQTIYNAQVYANTGAGTYEKAVDMAVKDFATAGLNCIAYANGARHTLKDYADMAIRTASKRAYLQGEGVKRQEWGIATVIMNKRGNPCPKCLPFCGKVLIDDVWSGGGKKDGPYPLMSKAIAAGLYHPRCKDSHTTYFPGISTADDTWTKKELEAIGEDYRKEQYQQYAERQEKKFGRLADFSLDPENQQKYKQKQKEWKHVRMRTGDMSSQGYAESKSPVANFRAVPQEKVVDVLRNDSKEWITELSEKEKHAIGKYTYNSGNEKPNRFFERLNAMLRGDIPEDKKLLEYAETISGALKKSRIKHDIVAYRNLDLDIYSDFEINDLITEEQFTSTSVTKGAALDKPYKILIYVPKGSKGAYIEELSKFPKQRELLLDKDTVFRVISKKEKEIELKVIT